MERRYGVSLKTACLSLGFAYITYWQWSKGKRSISHANANRVADELVRLSGIDVERERLRERRRALGISQLELSQRIGTPQGQLCRWEAGTVTPTPYSLQCWKTAIEQAERAAAGGG